MSDHINELYDKDGNLIGVLMSAEAWNHVKGTVLPALGLEEKPKQKEISEPISEWETLQQYWDYPYPVDTDVACENCGNSTDDWSADSPRKFYLTSANLAGLVSFKCEGCQAKILKKHFKDEIRTECVPFVTNKDHTKEARY